MLIAMIGLGHMGRAMAARLSECGFRLRVWNRTPGAEHGLDATVCESAAEATHGADVALTSLSNDEAVREVVLGDAGVLSALAKDSVHIGTSTISYAFARELVQRHAERERTYLSVPVLGRPEAAHGGKLYMLAGGDPDSLERCRPIFEALGDATFDFPDAPSANLAKILANFMIAGTIELLGEVFTLGEKGGIPAARTFQLLTHTLFASPIVEGYGRRIVDQSFEPAGMRMALGLKDVELALSVGREKRVPLPTANVIRDHYLTALASGLERLDWSGVSKVVREQAGLT